VEALEERCVPTTWSVITDSDNVNQAGSLRWAVAHAGNGDTIVLNPQASVVNLTQGELVVNHDVTIESVEFNGAPGMATITANESSRDFEIARNAHVTLKDLIIEGGNAMANNPMGNASLDGRGGAILNEGNLLVDHCDVSSNGSSWRGYDFHVKCGGGIYNYKGTLELTATSLVDNNFAVMAGGGIYNDRGVMVIAHSDLDGNTTFGDGGAIYDTAGKVVLVVDCQMWDNHANKMGGALYTRDDQSVTVGSTIMGENHAGLSGGAVFNYDTWLFLNSGATLKDNYVRTDSTSLSIESLSGPTVHR
jgi:hypothetical protein